MNDQSRGGFAIGCLAFVIMGIGAISGLWEFAVALLAFTGSIAFLRYIFKPIGKKCSCETCIDNIDNIQALRQRAKELGYNLGVEQIIYESRDRYIEAWDKFEKANKK